MNEQIEEVSVMVETGVDFKDELILQAPKAIINPKEMPIADAHKISFLIGSQYNVIELGSQGRLKGIDNTLRVW